MKFNKKGQGALEYLLLIGGAVLIAVIVIALLVGMGSSGRNDAQAKATSAASATQSLAVAPIVYSDTCNIAGDDGTLTIQYNGGNLSLTIDGVNYVPSATELVITQLGTATTGTITDLCLADDQHTIILTATNPSTNTTASATYVITNNIT